MHTKRSSTRPCSQREESTLDLGSQVNITYSFIDDLSINNSNFKEHFHEIYPHEINETTESGRSASYFDILLSFNGKSPLNNLNVHITKLIKHINSLLPCYNSCLFLDYNFTFDWQLRTVSFMFCQNLVNMYAK